MANRGATGSSARAARHQRVHVLALEFRRLTESTSNLLAAALVGGDGGADAAEIFRERLTWPVDDVAVIEKCNAVIVVATVSVDADPDFVREVLLDRWLEVAPDLERVIDQIDHHAGRAALQHLGEVAVGLRSVVLGDGQVHAQVVSGLRTARGVDDQRSPFSLVARRLGGLRATVRNGTTLQEGNVSLERIAAERIVADLGTSGARVAVVGLGRTGQLIATILSKETDHDVVATNRTARRYEGTSAGRLVTAPWGDLSLYESVDAVLLCLSNTAETRRYTELALRSLDGDTPPLVIDMSSPSITRQLATRPERVVHLDQLAAEASGSLDARRRGINKAKQAVAEWAEDVHHDLAAVMAAQSPVGPHLARRPRSSGSVTRRNARLLGSIRDHLAGEGFHETLTPATSVDERADRALRRSIRVDSVLAADEGIDRAYEVGPIWSPEWPWAPSEIDEAHVLTAGLRRPADLDEVIDLATGIVQRVVGVLRTDGPGRDGGPELAVRRLDYATAIETLQRRGFSSVAYGAGLDFDLLRSIADVVRFDTGEPLVVLTDGPEPSDRFDIARDPKTGLARSFRVVLDGWQVASGALVEVDGPARRRRIVLAGGRVRSDLSADEPPPLGTFEVALDHLAVRSEERPRTQP